MARYIDADALMEELNSLSITVTGFRGGKCYWSKIVEEYKDTVLRIISEQGTVDVVPKSEYDELKAMLDAAIAGQETLQKALAEAKSNNEIRGESFYFELEKFEERGKQLEREHDAEVARGMIEFIKGKIKELEDHTPTKEIDQAIALVNWILGNVINDLEKKYTEGTANEKDT